MIYCVNNRIQFFHVYRSMHSTPPIIQSTRDTLWHIQRKHYIAEHRRALNLDVLGPALSERINTQMGIGAWSTNNRILVNEQYLKYLYLFGRADTTAICFKMTMMSDDPRTDPTSCVYGWLYCRCAPDTDLDSHGNPQLQPIYVCAGPTFRSQDGEYRGKVLPWAYYLQLFEYHAAEFAAVEAAIVHRLSLGQLNYQVDFCYPDACRADRRQVEEFVNVQRVAIRLHILCWVSDFFNIHNKVAENHMNPAYQYIIYQHDDIPVLQELIKRMGRENYFTMMGHVDFAHADLNEISAQRYLQVGQKMRPLGIQEAASPGNINYDTWREIYITTEMSRLLLNFISPCIPMIGNWFYVQHAHAGVFDSFSIHERYAEDSHVNQSLSTSGHSHAEDSHVNQSLSTSGHSHAEDSHVNQSLSTSGHSHAEDSHVNQSLSTSGHSHAGERLSDLAVCVTGEYVGRTLRDLTSIIREHDYLFGMDLVFADGGVFAKHIFEFIYTFYCMNTTLRIIHADAHANNATMYRLYVMGSREGKMDVERPHIVYIAAGLAYLFPHYGIFSNLIDYSRAIIGDYAALTRDFGGEFAASYHAGQQQRILDTLYRYFPRLVEKHRTVIENLLSTRFDALFKALTVIDTYVLTSNLATMLNIDSEFTDGRVKIAPEAHVLLSRVVARAERLLIMNLQGIIEGRLGTVDDFEWPNLVLIREEFAKYQLTDVTALEGINVVDAFNSSNEPRWCGKEYSTFGPLLSVDWVTEILQQYDQPPDPDVVRWREFTARDETKQLDELAARHRTTSGDSVTRPSPRWMYM
jgi:hypothetical protein